ncbi:MAG TPA: thiol:disulfide interchange protein DsbA/DsbL [Rudaea sp.]|nr:thiol:disulfide interchange protein DsbA/DsbL [Rudaea sp.]
MLKYVLVLVAGLVAAMGCNAQEHAREWKAGADYFLIDPPQPTATGGDKIEVLEVFSYACPHCAHFQPYAEELKSKLPPNAKFALLPAVFQPAWEPFARAFYTAKSLGVLDKTHQALFDAIHRDRQPLHTIEDLANLFYSNYGVNPASFLSTATSFVIEGELAHGNDLVRDYHVDATPTLIVNGKYRVTGLSERGIGFPEMVEIALDLVKQESAKKAHK